MAYLDYNTATLVDKRVIESMISIFDKNFGSPSSTNHDTGRMTHQLVDDARKPDTFTDKDFGALVAILSSKSQ